jgi:hypothetical protein
VTGLLLEFTMEDGSVFTHTSWRPVVIGHAEGEGILRMADGDFVGLPDSRLSRPHCVFAPVGDGWVVNDAGSEGGTYVVVPGAGVDVPVGTTLPVVDAVQLRIGHTMVRAAVSG